MSRNTKIGIAVITGIILLGLCTCVGIFYYLGNKVMQSIITDPAEIEQLHQELAECDVPEGYTENGMRLLGFQPLILSNYLQSPESIIIMVFRADMQLSQEGIDQALQQISHQNQNTAWVQVDILMVTIQDQSIEMLVMEKNSGSNQRCMMQCIWSGFTGIVTLRIIGVVQNWDQSVVDAFLSSVR